MVEKKRALAKQKLQGKKMLSQGWVGTEGAGNRASMEAHLEFEASKTPSGTCLVGEYYGTDPLGRPSQEIEFTISKRVPSKCPSCGHHNSAKWDFCEECGTEFSDVSSRAYNFTAVIEEFRNIVQSFEGYFNLEEDGFSRWHDENINFSRIDGLQILKLLTTEAKSLREIAGDLNIQRIGDIRKLRKKLIDLASSKPSAVGGLCNVRCNNPIETLEGYFWRRETTK